MEEIRELLRRRSDLVQRLMLTQGHMTREDLVHRLSSYIPLEELEKLVEQWEGHK